MMSGKKEGKCGPSCWNDLQVAPSPGGVVLLFNVVGRALVCPPHALKRCCSPTADSKWWYCYRRWLVLLEERALYCYRRGGVIVRGEGVVLLGERG